MRIMLNKLLPTLEELALLVRMGFDVSKIEDQYNRGHHNRGHYYIETFDPAFTERVENAGIGRSKKTISFYGIDVMYVYKCSLLNESSIKFELDEVGVECALAKEANFRLLASWQMASADTAPVLKADRFKAF